MQLLRSSSGDTNTRHDEKIFYTGFLENNEEYLLMFFKTAFVYRRGDKLVPGEKNHYILFPPDSVSEHGSCDEGFVNDWIFFRGNDVKELVDKLNIPLATPFYIGDHSIIETYIKKIAMERTAHDICCEERISLLLVDMLIELGRQYGRVLQTHHSAFGVINDARMYMLNHIEDDISVQNLALRFNYSVSRFCVLYDKFFHITPIEDLLNARIEKAISLLKYGNTSITEIAELCGFSSIHYFSRKFKEKTGVAPSRYLKR